MQVIAAWLLAHVPEPSRLLVSGSSAGAYGAATHYATLRTLYPRAHDAVQRDFYKEMGAPNTCDAWTTAMRRELTRRQATPNFRSYLAQGDTHTILRSPLVYSQQSGGQPFVAWLDQLLNGPMPANQTCTNCPTTAASCAPKP